MKNSNQSNGLSAGFLLPHPPVIVPDVGKGRESEAAATVSACKLAALEISRLKPDTLIVLSPHAPLYRDYVYIYNSPTLSGSFASFGAPEPVLEFRQDSELREALVDLLKAEDFDAGSFVEHGAGTLDHGVLVPLYFIRGECPSVKIVALASAAFDMEEQYKLGTLIRKAAEQTGRRVCIVASGDMSHKVNSESPYGTVKEGALFDREITDALQASDLAGLLSIDPELREKAAECGYGSIVILCGAFDQISVRTHLIGYEAPFGIGYCVASFKPLSGTAKVPVKSDLRVRIARYTMEKYISGGLVVQCSDLHVLCHDSDDNRLLGELLGARAGVFVSLKKMGSLRGCIGTTSPTTANIAEEIIQNAISASTRDPRFEPVASGELDLLETSVDVLGTAEPVRERSELDPSVWGVIVSYKGRRGLLLPDLEGVDTVDQQLSIACRKASLDPFDPYSIEKFSVTRYR